MRFQTRKSAISAALLLFLFFSFAPAGAADTPISLSDQSAQSADSAEQLVPLITVSETVQLSDAKRFGINIGARSQYGAAQFLKNLIPNPGFEAGEFGMLFLLDNHQGGTRLQADYWDTNWNNSNIDGGQPIGFWNGAEYEFLSGNAAGRSGMISSFTHENNLYTWNTANQGVWPAPLDVVAVRGEIAGFYGDMEAYNSADTTTTRPGSSGSQSLKLDVAPNFGTSYVRYFDSYGRDIDTSAGKLLIIDGDWHFEIYAKAQTAGDTLMVQFRRLSGTTFLNQNFTLTTEWQKYEATFSVADGLDSIHEPRNADGTSNPLAFEIRLDPSSDSVWIDDVVLQRANSTNSTAFTDSLVDALGDLQPGILRNWGDQLGTSLDNQLADSFARKSAGYHPKHNVGLNWHYSLHEFLELCAEVGAEPWYVIPPSFSADDLENLIAYLSAPAGQHSYADTRSALGQTAPWSDVFDTIHLEYGNEIWGAAFGTDPFLGATVRGGERASEIAGNRFAIMQASPYYSAAEYNMVIGGQAFYAGRQMEIEMHGSDHDSIGLAPYFGELSDWSSNEAMFHNLYAHAKETVTDSTITQSQHFLDKANQGTELAIYELNLRGLTGDSPIETRNNYLGSQAAGIALPLTMMSYQSEMGIRDILGFVATQFSHETLNGDYARFFGMMRDIEATGRKRPTWLGVEMANKAVRGDMITTDCLNCNSITPPGSTTSFDDVQSFAYQDGNTYAIVLYNLNLATDRWTQLSLPHVPNSTATVHVLESDGLFDGNESAELVTIETTSINNFNENYGRLLKPHSMTVIEWTVGATPTAVTLASNSVSTPNGSIAGLLLVMVWLAYMSRLAWVNHE